MTTILLLLLANCCSVLFAWRFIAMKHLGLICVFSSHDIVSFVGGVIGRVGNGFRVNSTSIQSVQSKLFSQAERIFKIKCSYLYTTNLKFVARFEMFVFFPQPLNVWFNQSVNGPFWTGLIEPDQRPLTCGGRARCGEGSLFWMLWSSLFSVRGWTDHAPLPLHQHRLTLQSEQWN